MDIDDFDLPIGEPVEIERGVIVERRDLLATLALALAGVALGSRRADAQSASASLSFEEFLRDAVPVAKRLVADATAAGQQTYLHTLASFAVRLASVPVPEMRDSGQGAGPGTFIGFNPGGDPFAVLHWRMEPGSEVRRHAHTYGNVVTLGLEGAARVENFEMVDARDFKRPGTFKVRRTVDQWLTPGTVNLVNLERSYIHGSRAGRDGARGLDITTRLHEKQPTPYLHVGNAAATDEGVLEGSWTD